MFELPSILLDSFSILPVGASIAGLIRHAERETIVVGEFGNEVALTKRGEITSQLLVGVLKDRLVEIYSSPVKRCAQTAKILEMANELMKVNFSNLLGDPGIFVQNCAKAHTYFLQNQPLHIAQHLLSEEANPDGFCISTKETVNQLVAFLLSKATKKGISLFITHDSILSVVVGVFFGEIALEKLWPDYLEAIFFWQDQDNLHVIYREHYKKLLWIS